MNQHKNTTLRAQRICEITRQHYEPENQARCYKAVWRKYIYPVYPMCYRTYLNHLRAGGIEVGLKPQKATFKHQLKTN